MGLHHFLVLAGSLKYSHVQREGLASSSHLQTGLTRAGLADGALRQAGIKRANWTHCSTVRPGGQHGPSTCLATVQRGESVRVFNPDAKRWSGQATVLKIRRHGASVWLRTANGRILVHNQRFLKPLATTQPGKKTVAENNSSGTKMVTRSRGKKMEVTKS
jgi:hypothetical protein